MEGKATEIPNPISNNVYTVTSSIQRVPTGGEAQAFIKSPSMRYFYEKLPSPPTHSERATQQILTLRSYKVQEVILNNY